jgi:lactate dehydrogenase-like 2-hydroxyacid dehydrogenase
MILSLFNNLNKRDREFDQDIGTEKAIGDMSWMVKVGIIGYGNMKSLLKNYVVLKWKCCDMIGNVGDANAKAGFFKELQQKADVLSLHIGHRKLIKWLMRPLDAFTKSFWVFNTLENNVVTADW